METFNKIVSYVRILDSSVRIKCKAVSCISSSQIIHDPVKHSCYSSSSHGLIISCKNVRSIKNPVTDPPSFDLLFL